MFDADDQVGAAAAHLSIELPALTDSRLISEHIVSEASSELAAAVPEKSNPIDVVVLGSLARGEASAQSDFDYLVISHGLSEDVDAGRRLIEAADDLCEKLGLEAPGPTGMFGDVMSAADLVERIGLDHDTNLTHSRRILLLQESRSLYQPALNDRLRESVLQRYLYQHRGLNGTVPRFLLNDLLRYWRTVAVDYEAKRWRGRATPWGLRYLKLLITRKLLIAGSVVSLFMTPGRTHEEDDSPLTHLSGQFQLRALERVAQLAAIDDDVIRGAVREILVIADWFSDRLSDEQFRNDVSSVTDAKAESPAFLEAKDRGRALHAHIETILYETDQFGQLSRTYLTL